MKPQTIDFRGTLFDRLPRKLWQVLFDFYRALGGPVHNMDNMLIDYENCKSLFDRLENDSEIKFVFGFNSYLFNTTWVNEEDWIGENHYEGMGLSGYDYFVLGVVTSDKAELRLVFGGQGKVLDPKDAKPCGGHLCMEATGDHEEPFSDGSNERPYGKTFGYGKLDPKGYWEFPCPECARAAEKRDGVFAGAYWPHDPD